MYFRLFLSLGKDLQHLLVDFSVRCEDLPGIIAELSACEIGHLSPGFLDYEPTCRRIPREKVQFPEGLKPAAGHIAKVKACTPGPANGLRGDKEIPEMDKVFIHTLAKFIRKSGHQEAFFELFNGAYFYAFAVKERTLAFFGIKKLVMFGIIHYAEDGFSGFLEAYGYGIKRESMGKICGPVNRVYDPFKAATAAGLAGFFRKETDIRELLAKRSYKDRFDLAVYIGNEVNVAFI